ncbi:MAG: ATP-dependent DNA helicase RecG [Actinomycetota bacterium]|nr:ATP-dependent DNA helicase RecG [Actinomycetota bacterium]
MASHARQDPAATRAAWGDSVSSARFVDAARTEALSRLGIQTVGDLVCHYPFRYLDLTETAALLHVKPGTDVTVVGRVHAVNVKKPRPRLTIVEVAIVDGTGVLLGVWFNQPYMASRFVEGEHVAFAGRVTLDYGMKQIRNPLFEKLGGTGDPAMLGRILPVHRTTDGLSTSWLRRLVAAAVDDFGDVEDFLPSEIRVARELMPRRAALRAVQFPSSHAECRAARRRLAFEELFVLQVGLALRRHAVQVLTGVAHQIGGPALGHLVQNLPFELTCEQCGARDDVLGDMASSVPANRMLLGDVGTGKTVVAAHALCVAADSGHQAAMMAPTEVLATQYADKVGPMMSAAGVPWALLTGSTPARRRREIVAGLADGSLCVAFGTHALIEKGVSFADLSLAIVDEQHRFGVAQRLGLRSKGAATDLLVMTATPIPRSLALTLYGDLDTSYLRERPISNTPQTVTEVVPVSRRRAAYDAIRSEVAAGRQAYIVCALVDESDSAQARAAVKEADRLATQVFPDLRVGLLTGRMVPAEKSKVMDAFRRGEIDVLVSTTVIEVGIDVPNATIMIVEDAERFGLAQLHQLRGRVGRGEHPGRFILFPDARTEESRRRMEAISSTNDGFELARLDMTLRGEGQILGQRQSGLPELKLADLTEDMDLVEAARDDARAIVDTEPGLDDPRNGPLRHEVEQRFDAVWEWVSSG